MEETLSILTQSKNEYSSLLTTKLTPHIIEGIYSIFNEAKSLCDENNEELKYLMTFQQFLSRISRWNSDIINTETERIKQKSNCPYLEDLLTCVHISQAKILTSVRVGIKQKKLTTKVPSLEMFIHKVYIESARNIYKNVYLFELDINSLQKQKYRREIELLVQYSILNVIRNTLPVEEIIRAYLDESTEYDNEEVIEEVIEEPIQEPIQEPTYEQFQTEQQIPNTNIEKQSNTYEDDIDGVLREKNIQLKNITDKLSSIPDIKREHTQQPLQSGIQQSTQPETKNISFNNVDTVKEYDTKDRSFAVNTTTQIEKTAPKDIETLEQISFLNNERRKQEEEEEYETDDEDVLKIGGDVPIESLDLKIESL